MIKAAGLEKIFILFEFLLLRVILFAKAHQLFS